MPVDNSERPADRRRTAAPAIALLLVASALLVCVIARSQGVALDLSVFGTLVAALLGTAGWAAVAEERALARGAPTG